MEAWEPGCLLLLVALNCSWYLIDICKASHSKKSNKNSPFPRATNLKTSSPAAIAGAYCCSCRCRLFAVHPLQDLMKRSTVAMENKKSLGPKTPCSEKKTSKNMGGGHLSSKCKIHCCWICFFFSKLKMKTGIMEYEFFNMLENSSTLCWRPSNSELNPWKMLIEALTLSIR